jgi:non-ribosomal peptide synthetase component E (peptide arylation enzyme)
MIRPSAGRPEDIALLPFSRGQDGRLRPVPVTHREFIESLDRADRTAGITGQDLVLAMPPVGDGLAYTTLVDCALLRGATVVAVRRQELAMAAIGHHGTVAIVPRDCVLAVPEKVRVLPVG